MEEILQKYYQDKENRQKLEKELNMAKLHKEKDEERLNEAIKEFGEYTMDDYESAVLQAYRERIQEDAVEIEKIEGNINEVDNSMSTIATDKNIQVMTIGIKELEKEIKVKNIELSKKEIELQEFYLKDDTEGKIAQDFYIEQNQIKKEIEDLESNRQQYEKLLNIAKEIRDEFIKNGKYNELNKIETPAPTTPAPTTPAPTTPAPTRPAPTRPAPTRPAPTRPAPTRPAPTRPAPTRPAPTRPAPTGPAPTRPAPTRPAPTRPAPTRPAPTTPAPTRPAPTRPAPTRPAPTTPAPTTPAPTTPAPTTPAPTTPAPTTPALSIKSIVIGKELVIEYNDKGNTKTILDFKKIKANLYKTNEDKRKLLNKLNGIEKIWTDEELDGVDYNVIAALSKATKEGVSKGDARKALENYIGALKGNKESQESTRNWLKYDIRDMKFLKPRNMFRMLTRKKQYDRICEYADLAYDKDMAKVQHDSWGPFRRWINNRLMLQPLEIDGKEYKPRTKKAMIRRITKKANREFNRSQVEKEYKSYQKAPKLNEREDVKIDDEVKSKIEEVSKKFSEDMKNPSYNVGIKSKLNKQR